MNIALTEERLWPCLLPLRRRCSEGFGSRSTGRLRGETLVLAQQHGVARRAELLGRVGERAPGEGWQRSHCRDPVVLGPVAR